ncbi:hypothetical protein [Ohessyouella blattaphilus]|uniref:Uncharacterized protein n=1 Tax=Ohessyouella blattaphilus TaxID=2949333 RepID=A0ABT1EIN4_9FIRM|nr:hypothetical protein [Ohessyouella blattaphilus]MCP1110329.1 hypothetical protein [Ohessyouella blattaphilus]MCR8563723.1 hypothetical protein [Ohessyouella blattaphilus]
MANKRMFSRGVVDTDNFIDMPLSAQALYFHLGLRADDDGLVGSPKKIQRMIGASREDIEELVSRNFIIALESGVVVITHWRINNNKIKGDRYKETLYPEEKESLIECGGKYALKDTLGDCKSSYSNSEPKCNQDGTNSEPQSRLDKNRLDKSREKEKVDYQQIADLYNDTCVSFPRLTKLSDNRKRAIKARMKSYTLEDFKRLFETAEASSFLKGQNDRNWSATFDWLITDKNMVKVLDGNYHDNIPKKLGRGVANTPAKMFREREYNIDELESQLIE